MRGLCIQVLIKIFVCMHAVHELHKAEHEEKSLPMTYMFHIKLILCFTGDSYQSLSFFYRLGRTTIGEIVPETCTAIVKALKDKYLKVCLFY